MKASSIPRADPVGAARGSRSAWRARTRALRWIAAGALALVAIAILFAVAALIAIHTAWGRELVRRRLVAALGETFRGQVTIGALEGSPFGTLVARDVVIDDATGRPAIAIDRIEARVHLWGLAHHELRVSELDARGVRVLARQDADGALDLARLTRPEAARRWSVTIDDAHLHGAALDARIGGRAVHLDDVELDGSAAFPASGAIAVRASGRARWREQDVPIAIAAQLAIEGGRARVPYAELALGELVVIASGVEVGGDRAAGVLLAAATPRGVRALAPDAPLAPPIVLVARLAPIVRDGPRIAITLGGIVGGAPIAGGAIVDPRGRRAVIALGALGVDGAALAAGAPRSSVDLRALVDVAARPGASGLAALDGELLLTAAGRVRDVRIDGLALAATARAGAFDTSVHTDGPGAAALALAARLVLAVGPARWLRGAARTGAAPIGPAIDDDAGPAAIRAAFARGDLVEHLAGRARSALAIDAVFARDGPDGSHAGGHARCGAMAYHRRREEPRRRVVRHRLRAPRTDGGAAAR